MTTTINNTNNTTSSNFQDGTIFTYWRAREIWEQKSYSLTLNYYDEERKFLAKIEEYEYYYERYYKNYWTHHQLYNDPVKLFEFICESINEEKRYFKEMEKLEKENEKLEEENEELKNSSVPIEEVRALRQTIRQQMQTIASLQMRLNQNRINRDSFNPMEDIEE